MKMIKSISALLLVLVANQISADDKRTPTELFTETSGISSKWEDYLTDSAAGSVSAAGLLGIDGQSVKTVENVRDLVAAFDGFRTEDGQGTMAFSITPGRTEVTHVDLPTYYENPWARQWANTTFGYAQGKQEISSAQFDRYAYSVETSILFDRAQDPVLAFADAIYAAQGKCALETDPVIVAAAKAVRENGETIQSIGRAIDNARRRVGNGEHLPEAEKPEALEAQKNALEQKQPGLQANLAAAERVVVNDCYASTMTSIAWNRSRVAFLYGGGWIKPIDESLGGEKSLGHTAVITGTWGVHKSVGLTALLRGTWDEPILETLGTGAVQKKDSTLIVGRAAFGGERLRFLVEGSNAKDKDVTASQRAFKVAAGLDARVYNALWVSLRFGRQSKVSGGDDESASLLSISYSPTALLSFDN